jgi:hypothetical protein
MRRYRDFRCHECGHVWEEFLGESDPAGACPACGCRKSMRLFPAPHLQTDTTFFRGAGTLLDQCGGDDREAERIARAAIRQGYKPSPNDLYLPTLAQRPGDPGAFIQREGGRGQIRRFCEETGISCQGMVEVQAPQRELPKPKKLHERTIRRYMRKALEKDPSLAAKKSELRQQIIQTHARKKE